jgi:hypothetical protein
VAIIWFDRRGAKPSACHNQKNLIVLDRRSLFLLFPSAGPANITSMAATTTRATMTRMSDRRRAWDIIIFPGGLLYRVWKSDFFHNFPATTTPRAQLPPTRQVHVASISTVQTIHTSYSLAGSKLLLAVIHPALGYTCSIKTRHLARHGVAALMSAASRMQ